MINTVKGWFTKFSNDWSMNLASMLAYNILTSIFPILLALLTILSFLLSWNDSLYNSMQTGLVGAVPANARGFIDIHAALEALKKNTGLLSIISLLGLLWGGSNLFGVMEGSFDIVYRTKPRDFLPQKLMSIGMILIFAVLAPLMFGASTLINLFGSGTHALIPVSNGVIELFFKLLTELAAVLVAFVLFLAIYTIVPNLPLNPKQAWRGALISAILLVIVNLAFPLYTSVFMSGNKNYGAAAALALVVMAWFWFFSVILMLGAEVNSYAMGMRAMEGDIPTVIHEARVHAQGRDVDDSHAGKTQVGARREKRANRLDTKGSKASATVSKGGAAISGRAPGLPGRVVTGVGGAVGHVLGLVLGTVGNTVLAGFWLVYRAVRRRGQPA